MNPARPESTAFLVGMMTRLETDKKEIAAYSNEEASVCVL
jgi:hypothetical protein